MGDQCHTDKEHTHTHARTQIKPYISAKAAFTHTQTLTHTHTHTTYIAIISIMTEQLLTEVDDSQNSPTEK